MGGYKGCSRLLFMHWEFQGALWYFIASMGYFSYDILFGYLVLYCNTTECLEFNDANTPNSNILTVVWAVCYLVDSILYKLSLYFHKRELLICVSHNLNAEIGNMVASVLFLASQCLYYHPDFESEDLDTFLTISFVQGGLYMFSLLLWLFNSFEYFAAYVTVRAGTPPPERENTSMIKEWAFYGELFNLLPTLGYFAISLYSVIVLIPSALNAATEADPYIYFYDLWSYNQSFQLVVNIAWDLMYSIDALIYFKFWWDLSNDALDDNNPYFEMA